MGDIKRTIAMDGYVTKADGQFNKPIAGRPRPAPPAPMNIQPSAVKPPPPVKKPK